ncbi:glycoside hydrolase family 2 protein [Thermus neutrinimicus]|uniref:glycoside hydrolase family 2 protein n=1 Tax=Thermus neutrinimicus TaxID=2908149 RepID=UPI001FAA99B7|nr:glycoside hydrolase family 2 TIM barrel-domain containing protein [Thermus neutrinimicus]
MNPDPNHPRPTLGRPGWRSLEGTWDFALSEAERPEGVSFDRRIRVPFPPEAPGSGVGQPWVRVAWYRKVLRVKPRPGFRLFLRFGAVDYRAEVFLNGAKVLEHEGGHTPFALELTPFLGKPLEVLVRAEDDPLDPEKPRGKQALGEPGGIFYPRTTGIWQPVWLEWVPESHIASLRLRPDLEALGFHLEVRAQGEGDAVEVALFPGVRGEAPMGEKPWLEARFPLSDGLARGFLGLPLRGEAGAFLWRPENPVLFPLRLRLLGGRRVLDEAYSYGGLREVSAQQGVFLLNREPYFPKLVLDQGLWPEGHLAPPGLEALRRDILLAKALGFNGVRKHQKLEDPRYLHLADRHGLLVFAEMPSFFRFSPKAARRYLAELLAALERDHNHPSLVAWVLFNESWGLWPWGPEARSFLQGVFFLARSLDPTRLLVDNDGFEHGPFWDLYTVHDYAPPEVLARRYGQGAVPLAPMGRPLSWEGLPPGVRPFLSEFGGLRLQGSTLGWGYREVEGEEAFLQEVLRYLGAVCQSLLSGFCYTQLYDTFQEENGLLDFWRRPKVPPERVRAFLEGCEARRGLWE